MTNILVGFYISIFLYMFGFAIICSLLSFMMIHDSLPELDYGKFDMNPHILGAKPWFPINFPKQIPFSLD
jgi:hypothetical protein